MSEMVERVAQAICGDSNPENVLTIHRIRARAAIEAMREPTEAMVDHTYMQGASPMITASGPLAMIAHRWRLMIDEALK